MIKKTTTTKNYRVYFTIKANKLWYSAFMDVDAGNQPDAKSKVKKCMKNVYGHHPFDMHFKPRDYEPQNGDFIEKKYVA